MGSTSAQNECIRNSQGTSNGDEPEYGSSPEKNEMSLEPDFSYDGDSDVNNPRSGSSKIKKRRHKKHRGGSRSPSPKKHRKNSHSGNIDNDFSHDSQADQAKRVADFITGSSHQHKKNGQKSQHSYSYRPLAETRQDMSANAQQKLRGSIAAILGAKFAKR